MTRFATRAAICLLATWFIPAIHADAQTTVAFSRSDMDTTLKGNIQFHGPFCAEMVSVTAANLGPHDFVEISFDLLILRSWDGNALEENNGHPIAVGPDFFRMALRDGPTLLYTTFSNSPDDPGFRPAARYQNYPSQIPGDRQLAQSGAVEASTLGYNYPWTGVPNLFPMDATYHIHFTVPHHGPTAIVDLAGMNLQNIADESWGLVDVKIKPLATNAVKHPTQEQIAAAFEAVLGPSVGDPAAAFDELIRGMDNTASWISAKVAPQPLEGEKIRSLIKDLWADDTAVARRDSASTQLRAIGAMAEPFLRDARKTAPGEQRQRIDWTIQGIDLKSVSDENIRRAALATRLLEIIGTEPALSVRRNLMEK